MRDLRLEHCDARLEGRDALLELIDLHASAARAEREDIYDETAGWAG